MSVAKDKSELTEEQKLANLMFDLYPGLDRAFGRYVVTKEGDGETKTQGRATTELGQYKADLWTAHLLGGVGLGVIPVTDEATCSWGAIDIDVYPLDLVELEKKIHALNIPLLLIRTKSGGAHLVAYFKEPISCKKVRNKLYEFSLALGYSGVEIFPKQSALASKNDVGNWLNMPYYNYRHTTRYAIFRGQKLTILQFIELAEQIKVSEEQLMSIDVSVKGAFDDGPPCLQLMTRDGKVPEGARNNTLFAFAVYARKKWEDEWEDKVEELNVDFIDPPLKSKEVQTVVRSAGRKEYFYPCSKSPLQERCNKDLCKKRPYGIGELEEEFNLNLGSLSKILTDPPIWVIDVEGVRMQLDTEDLLDQTRFRRACMMAINRLPPLVKRNVWEKLIREKLESVEIVEAPQETRLNARLNQYVQQYLANTPTGESREELMIGRPWFDADTNTVYFRGNDLIRYLENSSIRVEARKVWNSLRESGACHKQLGINGKNVQVWYVAMETPEEEEEYIPEPDLGQEKF